MSEIIESSFNSLYLKLNTGASHCFVPRPLLFILYIYCCKPLHGEKSNIGQFSNNDKIILRVYELSCRVVHRRPFAQHRQHHRAYC